MSRSFLQRVQSKYNGLHPSKPRFFVDSAASTAADGGTVPGNEAPGKEEGTTEPMVRHSDIRDSMNVSSSLYTVASSLGVRGPCEK